MSYQNQYAQQQQYVQQQALYQNAQSPPQQNNPYTQLSANQGYYPPQNDQGQYPPQDNYYNNNIDQGSYNNQPQYMPQNDPYAQQQQYQGQQQQYQGQQQQQEYQQQQELGYNNVQPRTRLEREAMKDKESIEKTRINQRIGYETRNTDVRQLLHNSDPKSTLFIAENQRFDKDFSVFDKNQREIKFANKEVQQERHRIEALERESRRWEQMENQVQKEELKRQHQAEHLQAGKRNGNGMPFNPITLEYEKSKEGNQLRAKDDQAKVRGFVRAENLDTRNNCGYNILTGEQRMGVDTLVPNHLKRDFEKKIDQKNQFYSVKYQGEQPNNPNPQQNRYY